MPGPAMPGKPGMPDAAAGAIAVLVQPPPGAAVPAWFATAVAAVQVCGTDNRPTSADWFVPAVIPPPVAHEASVASPSGGTLTPGDRPGIPEAFPSPEPI